MATVAKTKKKTYVVLHPDGTYSKRTSVKDTVYTAAIVQVKRLDALHDYHNVRGAREMRRVAADHRARAGEIKAGLFEFEQAAPYLVRNLDTYTYRHTQHSNVREAVHAGSREEADSKLAARADAYIEWAEEAEKRAVEKEAVPRPEEGTVEYGECQYRSDPAAAERECERLNLRNDPMHYYHVAGVHLVPEGTKPADYVKALQVPF